MNPYQHGEVFVLDDGSEVDLDLGNYERFLDVNLTGDHNITTGKVYRAVIEKERRGDYLGRTVQIIPHVTDEIKAQLQAVGEKERADIVLVEVGGTVGDIEGMPFLEAVRQLAQEIGKENLRLKPKDEDMREWKAFLENLKNPDKEVTIALVGKYTHLKDSYISHIEAFHHAGAAARVHVKLKWVESVDLEKHGTKLLEGADGILVPGGFGDRGIEGKIAATRYAAEHDIPFQGVCLGFQLATIGFARDVVGLKGANSSEFDPKTPHPVVDLLPEQRAVKGMGATMRLGAHEIDVDPNSTTAKLYGATTIYERHRHRYEINPAYIPKLEDAGLRYVGRSDDGRRMEVLELKGHRYFVASQFHPELRSRPLRPSPIHLGLVRAAAR